VRLEHSVGFKDTSRYDVALLLVLPSADEYLLLGEFAALQSVQGFVKDPLVLCEEFEHRCPPESGFDKCF
jgi:hypothetical protein